MLTKKQIILELESIQRIVTKDYACNNVTLREALDNLRITVLYTMFDIESLKRELTVAKSKKKN